MNDIKRWSIAELRYAGGAEHDVKYVSEVDYGAVAAERDRAYAQRNAMAVALVKMALLLGWPAGRGVDGRQDHPVEWRQVVYVQLPGGEQVSYHIAPSEQHLLADLPEFTGDWDGNYTGTDADWPKYVTGEPVLKLRHAALEIIAAVDEYRGMRTPCLSVALFKTADRYRKRIMGQPELDQYALAAVLQAELDQLEPLRELVGWQRMSKMSGGSWWPCADKAEADHAVACGWTVRPIYA